MKQLSFIFQFFFYISILNTINHVTSQNVDTSNKDSCHRLNDMAICNAANQSGCSWCSEEWGCMFTSKYDILTQNNVQTYSCPEPCIQGDNDCYRIMDDSNLIQPFFFYLSTRTNMVCHLQHTNDIGRLHSIHCDELCRKALMNDFGYCNFYDDNGKEFKDYKSTGAVEKKKLSTGSIILIILGVILGFIVFCLLFKIYSNKHNKELEERRRLELEDSKLENDINLQAQIEQHRLGMEEKSI